MIDAVSSGLAGIQSGISSMNRSADRVSKMSMDNMDVDLTEEIVSQKVSETAIKAGLSMIRTADEMQGTLLDIIA